MQAGQAEGSHVWSFWWRRCCFGHNFSRPSQNVNVVWATPKQMKTFELARCSSSHWTQSVSKWALLSFFFFFFFSSFFFWYHWHATYSITGVITDNRVSNINMGMLQWCYSKTWQAFNFSPISTGIFWYPKALGPGGADSWKLASEAILFRGHQPNTYCSWHLTLSVETLNCILCCIVWLLGCTEIA